MYAIEASLVQVSTSKLSMAMSISRTRPPITNCSLLSALMRSVSQLETIKCLALVNTSQNAASRFWPTRKMSFWLAVQLFLPKTLSVASLIQC